MKQQVFDRIGMTRDEIVQAISQFGQPKLVPRLRLNTVRPKCVICGSRINKHLCQPFRQPKLTATRLDVLSA